jgi:hypothetical protein
LIRRATSDHLVLTGRERSVFGVGTGISGIAGNHVKAAVQAVRFMARPRGKEQRVDGRIVESVAESQSPKPADLDGPGVSTFNWPRDLPLTRS